MPLDNRRDPLIEYGPDGINVMKVSPGYHREWAAVRGARNKTVEPFPSFGAE